jgi:hypothetical protein
MNRKVAVWVVALMLLVAGGAFGQEVAPGPGKLEITAIPAGGTFFTSKGPSPDFGNYTYGGALTYNINPIVGIEGEVGGTAGVTQDLDLASGLISEKTPNTFNYSGNLVVSAPTGHSVVPFVTGGVGGLTMFSREALGIGDTETFLTGNVGGGLKWYAPNGRWGLRGDYRFVAVRGKDDAPAFFGQETRYGHRVYVGVIVNAIK